MFITRIKLDQSSVPRKERFELQRRMFMELKKMTPEGGQAPELEGSYNDAHVRWSMCTPPMNDDKMTAFSYTCQTLRAAVHGASVQAETPGWPSDDEIRSGDWDHAYNKHGLRIVWRPDVG
jgi:hypothetical protein